jgi:hypothetical protein
MIITGSVLRKFCRKKIECRFDPGTAKPKSRVHMLLAHLESEHLLFRDRGSIDIYFYASISYTVLD